MPALLGIHVFTGNDYSPAFYRKGKTRPITVMNKHKKFDNSFMVLVDPLTNEIINIIEDFTCHLYGYTKQTKKIFMKKLRFILEIKLNQNLDRSL